MAKRGNIKRFMLGFLGGVHIVSGLNPNQRLRLQEYGQLSAKLILFILKWSVVAVIFKITFKLAPIAEVTAWLVK